MAAPRRTASAVGESQEAQEKPGRGSDPRIVRRSLNKAPRFGRSTGTLETPSNTGNVSLIRPSLAAGGI
ncbi:hypothetical protein NDU88_011730 [Pleurodeles waltl]|uniref:Uncharacterized protein n=1 Tax=Pleurodeles waltl TaxID=8319 RepID=A0AAV7R2I6_PLEWA|nr:hypothetical protein NDU88_011730 [Pleurodeles waltl]